MAEPTTCAAERGADDDPVVPVFFLSDSTGISAETMGNALLIQFPTLRFERTLIPFISTVEEARGWWPILDAGAWTGPCTPLVFTTAAERRRPPGAAPRPRRRSSTSSTCTCSGSRRSSARARRAPGRPAARRRRHQALQHPDGGGGVHHRARRRPERPRPGEGRRDPGGALAVRQDADEHVPRAPARAVRRQLPARRRGPRDARAARGRCATSRDRCFGLTTTVERLSRVRKERRPDSRVRLARAVPLRAAPGRGDVRAHRIPSIDSSAKSVEEIVDDRSCRT